MGAGGGFVVDADLAKTDPARQPLEEAIALGKLPKGSCCARRQQAEVAGILRDFLPRAPIDQRVEAAHGRPTQEGFVVAIRLGGIDHVETAFDPVADQLLDQLRRVLAVAVHEQHRAAAGMVQSRHQGCFLAEIARQRHHLDVEPVGGKPAGDAERGVGAAVVDIDHLAGEAVALPQRFRQRAKPLVQQGQPGRLVVQGDDDRQPLRRGGGGGGRQVRNVRTQHHRSGSSIPASIRYSPPAVATMNETGSGNLSNTACCPSEERRPPLGRRASRSMAAN